MASGTAVMDRRGRGWGRWIRLTGVRWLALLIGGLAALAASPACAHGHGGWGSGGWGYGYESRAQMIKDANSWRDGFRGPNDFGGGVKIPHDAGLTSGLGGGLDGRGFGQAAAPLDGGGRLDGSDRPLDGGASPGYRSGTFAGSVQ
jgi:hypothetical protein